MKVEKLQLEEDEVILQTVRKHWFVLCIQLLELILLAAFPLMLFLLLSGISSLERFMSALNTPVLIALYTAWLLAVWMLLFSVWTNYYLDVWTITNKRLIVVDQHGFFSRTTASFRLERLQDIAVSINGIIPTLLDFGALEIQTAGEEEKFKATGLPDPGDLKATILRSADELLKKEVPIARAGM